MKIIVLDFVYFDGNNSYLNSKLIEIDYFDIFFNNGLYGIIVFIIITGYYLRLISKK